MDISHQQLAVKKSNINLELINKRLEYDRDGIQKIEKVAICIAIAKLRTKLNELEKELRLFTSSQCKNHSPIPTLEILSTKFENSAQTIWLSF